MNVIQTRSFDKYFRFGSDRGKVGNGLRKRQERLQKLTPTTYKRHVKKKWKNHLLSSCLAEDLGVTEGLDFKQHEYVVNFKNRPLLGKSFLAQVVTETKSAGTTVGKKYTQPLQDKFATMQHYSNESAALTKKLTDLKGDEETSTKSAIEAYDEKFKEAQAELKILNKIASYFIPLQRDYNLYKTKNIRLRVIGVSKSSEKGWDCLCIKVK